MTTNNFLEARADELYARMLSAGHRRGMVGPEAPQLLAATKSQSTEAVTAWLQWCSERGMPLLIGENYVQEAEEKLVTLRQGFPRLSVHLIGALQRNKVRKALELFDVIQSVDRLQLFEELVRRTPRQQQVMLQINISRDPRKAGFSPEDLSFVLERCIEHDSLIRPVGLMTITELYASAEDARADYRKMAELRQQLLGSYRAAFVDGRCLLSMGMSGDFEVAIEEGADIVRLGSALFGPRS